MEHKHRNTTPVVLIPETVTNGGGESTRGDAGQGKAMIHVVEGMERDDIFHRAT